MSKCFTPLRLLFTRRQSCVCAAGQVWQGLERQDESRRGRHRKSPVLVPCFLCGTLVAILFLQDGFKQSFTEGLNARAILQKPFGK